MHDLPVDVLARVFAPLVERANQRDWDEWTALDRHSDELSAQHIQSYWRCRHLRETSVATAACRKFRRALRECRCILELPGRDDWRDTRQASCRWTAQREVLI